MSGGGRPNFPFHQTPRCHGCTDPLPLGGFAWLYTGTRFALCDRCHRFAKRPEARELVSVEFLLPRDPLGELWRL